MITGINTDAVMFLCDTEINLSVCNDNLQSILKQPIKMNKKEYKKIGMKIKDKREIILFRGRRNAS